MNSEQCIHVANGRLSYCPPLNQPAWTCQECQSKNNLWLCLTCGVLNCGRYHNADALKHFRATNHNLVIDLETKACYCYKCDDFVGCPDIETSEELIAILKAFQDHTLKSNLGSNDKSDSNLNDDEGSDIDIGSETPIPDRKNSIEVDIGTEIFEYFKAEPPTKPAPSSRKRPHEDMEQGSPTDIRTDDSETKDENVTNSQDSTKKGLTTEQKEFRRKKTAFLSMPKPPGLAGMKNLGNTCFMNSVLQALSNIDALRTYFLNQYVPIKLLPSKTVRIHQTRSKTQNAGQVSMCNEFQSLLKEIWQDHQSHEDQTNQNHEKENNSRNNSNNNQTFGSSGTGIHNNAHPNHYNNSNNHNASLYGYSNNGIGFALAPYSLLTAVWTLVPSFQGYHQQDAQEFLRYFLEALDSENPAKIVQDIFQGSLWSEVTCLECNKTFYKEDPFLDLSLNIPEIFLQKKKKETDTPPPPMCALQDCLKSFVELEKLSESEKYDCAHCKRMTNCSKKFYIRKLPKVLCLHLKRFAWQRLFRSKLNTKIPFPLKDLDMSPYLETGPPTVQPAKYELISAIIHHGGGSGSGHYTCYTYHSPTKNWYHMNDSRVELSNEDEIKKAQAYILIYKLQTD